jgi:hypothetical protein
MPSSGQVIVASPSLIQAFARSLSLPHPLRQNRPRATVIVELPNAQCAPRAFRATPLLALIDAPIREKAIQHP